MHNQMDDATDLDLNVFNPIFCEKKQQAYHQAQVKTLLSHVEPTTRRVGTLFDPSFSEVTAGRV